MSEQIAPAAQATASPGERPHSHEAKRIDGKEIAKGIREQLNHDIAAAQQTNPNFAPRLVIFQVGDRPDSSTYVRMKLNAAKEANINAEHRLFSEDVTEHELLAAVQLANDDTTVHGILVQLPLPEQISEHTITGSVSDEKDVDGFGVKSIGELAKNGGRPLSMPCTPLGIMELLKSTSVEIAGKHAVVLGRSDIVGSPVSFMLRNADATVTLCHSKTRNIEDHIRMADIVVAAIGKAQYVKGSWLKPGAIVIDVGMNYIPDSSRKSGQRVVGDVDYDSAKEVASFITPVPGGVGPMTVAMLLHNVFESAKYHASKKDS